jgi:anti-sigma B factor antagonist
MAIFISSQSHQPLVWFVKLADRRIVDTEHDDGCPERKAVLMSFAAHARVNTPAPPPLALAPAGDAERAGAGLVPFTVEVQRHGDVAIVEPRGELDVATAPTLSAILEEIKSAARLVLDLRGLSFIDSSGLHLLIALDQRAQRDGFQLALVAPAPPVDRAIQVSGLGKTLPFVSPSAIE